MQLSIAWEVSSNSPTMELSSEERRGLDDMLGMLLDVGDVIEAENVAQMFGVNSRSVDIIAVRSFQYVCQLFRIVVVFSFICLCIYSLILSLIHSLIHSFFRPPSWKIQLTISQRQIFRFTPCLVLGWGFRGRRIEWHYFRFRQIKDGGSAAILENSNGDISAADPPI